MKRIAIITGASSGFGKEFALQLDMKFRCIDEYWLVARSEDKLSKLSDELLHQSKIFTLDLSLEDSVIQLVNKVKKEHAVVKLLVNSAGFGKVGSVKNMNDTELSDMIKVNCTALALLSKKLIPYMDENSRIINIASSAAFLPQPDFAVYAASKSFVLSFTRALNNELKSKEIFATAVCPGPSDTGFFEVACEGASYPWYKKYFKADPKNIVSVAITDAINKKDVSVYGLPMNVFRLLAKVIPHRLILKFFNN